MSSIFSSDAWKKAVDTFKTKKGATQTLPTAAVGALSGVSQMPKQPLPTGLPQAALTAAKSMKSGAPSVPTVPAAATTAAQKMVSTTMPTTSRANQALNSQADLVNTPFNYDPGSDPALQAAIRAAQQNLSVNQKNTNAQLRATGQGKSSYSETVANQLAHQSEENIANNILPIYAQQAYQKRQDSIANNRNLYQDYNQEDFQNPITKSQITGNLELPPEAQEAYRQLIEKKNAAESSTITRDQRSQLSSEADKIRTFLSSIGVNISAFGANKTAAQASSVPLSIRTLAGQAQDLSTKNANLNAATTVANTTGRAVTPQTDWQGLYRQAADPNTPLTTNQQSTQFNQNYQLEQQAYQKARDSIGDAQWQATFDEDVKQNGLNYALQKLQEKNQTAYQNANLAISNDENSRAWLNYADGLNGSTETAKYNGISANQVYDSLKSEFTKTDALGKPVPLTPEDKDSLYQKVLSVGLPDGQDTQVMALLGLTSAEIAAFDKKYLGE